MSEVAGNGLEAVKKIQEAIDEGNPYKFNVIFMDCNMPFMDGFEATQQLRESGTDNVVIIAMTADVTSENITRCKEAGMDKVILKPLTIEKIIDVIEFCSELLVVNPKS